MNSKKLDGKLITEKLHCIEKSVSFKNITKLFETNSFHYPVFQTSLDVNKVNEMMESYEMNPDFLLFKNKIVIGVIVNNIDNMHKMYIVDGQHRLNMALELNKKGINDYFNFCYYHIKSDNEMKNLFIEINKDSHKNFNYVSLTDFNRSLYIDLKNYLSQNKKLFFENKKKDTNKLYNISEFVDILSERKYIERFMNIGDIINDIERKNIMFYNYIDYKEYMNEEPMPFYETEKFSIQNNVIYSLKNNNFVDFLCNTTTPHHNFKHKKSSIQSNLRIAVWYKEFKFNETGNCPICNYNIKMGKNGFHCGHIISESNGGQTNLENLRPICANCNYKMGKMNWDDYVNKTKIICI